MSLITRASAFLRDLTSAWAAPTPEQGNALARLIFKKVEVEDDRVATVVPKPDFALIFVLTKDNEKGWLDAPRPTRCALRRAGHAPPVPAGRSGPRYPGRRARATKTGGMSW